MALPPTIPTSFVPRPPASASRGFKIDFVGVFGFIAYAIFFIALVLAGGVFFYKQVLLGQKEAKDKELAAEQRKIAPATAQGFVRLNDRLIASEGLLDNHVALTRFFNVLEVVLPTTVRFTALNLVAGDGNAVSLEGSGTAKTFNALAAASANMAADGKIKNAIFSKLSVNKDNSVTFSLSATVDSSLVAFTAESLQGVEVPPPSAPAPAIP